MHPLENLNVKYFSVGDPEDLQDAQLPGSLP
jgi:hypothetical protein